MKYYSSIQREDVPQKLAVQDLFKELSVLKDQTMKSHSEANVREKLKFKKCDLHHMACSEVRYWKKTLMRRQFLTAKHSHPWVIEFTSQFQEVMLRFCLGNEETSLKREFSGNGKTDIIIDRENPFTVTYNSGNEVVKVHCHYRAWNNDNVPQFI